MRTKLAVPVLASILILGTLGLSYDAFAGDGNNGNNGCEKSNPNAKACEKNPNTKRLIITALDGTGENEIPDAICLWRSTADSSISDSGTTDENGMVTLSVPLDVLKVNIFCAIPVPVPPGPGGNVCNIDVIETITEVDVPFTATSCF